MSCTHGADLFSIWIVHRIHILCTAWVEVVRHQWVDISLSNECLLESTGLASFDVCDLINRSDLTTVHPREGALTLRVLLRSNDVQCGEIPDTFS